MRSTGVVVTILIVLEYIRWYKKILRYVYLMIMYLKTQN